MKVLLLAAVSKDGFITNDSGDVTSWTSEEDKEFFRNIRANHDLFVMGSKTYDALPKPLMGTAKRVVLTAKLDKYVSANPPGVVFSSATPLDFMKEYQDRYEACLLLGGAQLYASFLRANLVDEVLLTVEPIALGRGLRLLPDKKDIEDYGFTVTETKQLNKTGTTLFTFKRNTQLK